MESSRGSLFIFGKQISEKKWNVYISQGHERGGTEVIKGQGWGFFLYG